jgi:LmbE family N-acetylglucosaminyl deacetylase
MSETDPHERPAQKVPSAHERPAQAAVPPHERPALAAVSEHDRTAQGLPMPRGRDTRVLGVFAHPDDETFFAGGTLAAYREGGCLVRLVTLTAGEAGAVGPATAQAAARDSDATRIEEAAQVGLARYAEACTALGVTDFGTVEPGRWRDLGAARALPGTVAGSTTDEVAHAVKASLTATMPDVLISVDADGVTGHPDHIRTSEAVHRVLETLRTQGFTVPALLVSCVRNNDVHEAIELLSRLTSARPIGDGGIRGIPDDNAMSSIELTPGAVRAKRAALDVYQSGLGTHPIDALVECLGSVGDGVLLRAIAEVGGMDRERFRVV